MPELNHQNPEVRREMAAAARYWLDRGFDGIRMDAVRYMFENLEGDADLPPHAGFGNFASNHDLAADRPGTLFADEPIKQRAQAVWLLLGPGTPFVYHGNEIGQPQGPERGDVKHRKPLDWEEVARQRNDAGSLWHWHRRLIELRRDHASMRRGKAQCLRTKAGPELLALWRETDGDITLTLLNGSADTLDELTVTLPETPTVITPRWLLGEGPRPRLPGVALEPGSLAPYETGVLVFE